MKKKGVKIVLTLFLTISCIFMGVGIKKSVRAASFELNKLYFLSVANLCGTISFNTGSGTMEDVYGHRLVFKQEDLNSYFSTSYFSIRWGWSGTTANLLFYSANTSDLQSMPIFSIVWDYMVIGNQPVLIYKSFTFGPTQLDPYKAQVLSILCNKGLEAVSGYAIPGNYQSSKYIDTTTQTYTFMYCFQTREKRIDIWNEGRIDGENNVINNPGAYGLVDEDDIAGLLEQSYDEGYSDGQSDGYSEGYSDGYQEQQSENIKFTTILTNVFNSAGAFLNTKLIGELKIIHFIAVPLLLGLFLIILKIFRS